MSYKENRRVVNVTQVKDRAQRYEGPFSGKYGGGSITKDDWRLAYKVFAPECHHESHEKNKSIAEKGVEDIETFLKTRDVLSRLEEEI